MNKLAWVNWRLFNGTSADDGALMVAFIGLSVLGLFLLIQRMKTKNRSK